MIKNYRLKTRQFYILLHLILIIFWIFYGTTEILIYSILFSTFLWIFGVAIATHRYLSHHVFDCNAFWDKLLKVTSMLAVSNAPSHWAIIHRQHHAYSDTDKDPHSPYRNGFFNNAFHIYKPYTIEDKFYKQHSNDAFLKFLDKHPLKLLLGYNVILFLINPIAPIIFYVFPSIWTFWMTSLMVNSGAHFDLFGYRNFETKDHSRNIQWAWPLLFGESYHNNHHDHSWSYNQAVKWWEWDLEAFIIKYIIRGKNLRSYNNE